MSTTRRTVLTSACVTALLTACGFELRQPPNYAFLTLFSSAPENAAIGVKLRRSLESSGRVDVISNPRQIERAQVIFEQLF